MRKNILLLVILFIFLTGCAKIMIVETSNGDIINVEYGDAKEQNMPVVWKDSEGQIDPRQLKSFNAVPNKETALKIAMAIFANHQKCGIMEGYKPQWVLEYKEEAVWMVSFWRDDAVLGTCWSIAIQKSDGKILSIWVGE